MAAKDETPAKPIMVDVKIVRDTWEGENRKVAGTIIQVPIQAALWGIHDGLFMPAGNNPFKADAE